MGRVVAAYTYCDGRRIGEIQLGEGAAWVHEKGDFVWIGFQEPTEQDLRMLQTQVGLHELAIEDALHAHQVPKLEIYGDSLFVVLRTAALQDNWVAFGETHIFVGADYIITVRHGAWDLRQCHPFRRRRHRHLQMDPHRHHPRGPQAQGEGLRLLYLPRRDGGTKGFLLEDRCVDDAR